MNILMCTMYMAQEGKEMNFNGIRPAKVSIIK